MDTSTTEQTVQNQFWPKLAQNLARIPFASEAVAGWYAAFDPATPLKVKGILLAALAYFVLPFDVIPDFLIGLGFTDDIAVLATAFSMVRHHITDAHRQMAKEKLAEIRRQQTK